MYVSLQQLCGPQLGGAAVTIRQHMRPVTSLGRHPVAECMRPNRDSKRWASEAAAAPVKAGEGHK